MKKILISVFSLLCLILVGCTNETTTEVTTEEPTTSSSINLEAPQDLAIEKGVVSFSLVEDAESYTLKIMQDGVLVMNYNVNQNDDLSSVLEDGDYSASICAKKGNIKSPYSDPVEFTIGIKQIDITSFNEIKGEYLNSPKYVNMSGRTYYEEETERMYFYYTASGFKVSFTGTKLEAKIYATGYNNKNNEARIVVLVDGEVYPDGGHTIVLDKGAEATYTLCEDLENKLHTVEVLKRSEASDNTLALEELHTDGHFDNPPLDKQKHILVIGASGSTGYGNLAKNTNVVKNTYNSDGLKAFAYLTSRMYDTEITEINASGWGVKWGWNSQSGTANIPSAFTKTGILSTNNATKINYSYSRDHFDLIIINLGMNDFNAYLTRITDQDKFDEELKKYMSAVKAFYNTLLNTYDCPILLLHTSNTDKKAEGYYNEIAAEDINLTLESPRIFSIIIPRNGQGTSLGANSHANVQTHIWTADKIATWIDENLHWEKVNNNITFNSSRDTVN